ncbi:hypothetical protein ARMGADRAFT_1077934 [Armillaria gallica]|uniref:Uncharacterized protein n=1 Tax=Armillaria gallica TaxID=47427 RepID=A0A2H3DMU2_ARMGA|nr:hypothetical protein ARMGADRAFT_1077934 [Armillaria gallica]
MLLPLAITSVTRPWHARTDGAKTQDRQDRHSPSHHIEMGRHLFLYPSPHRMLLRIFWIIVFLVALVCASAGHWSRNLLQVDKTILLTDDMGRLFLWRADTEVGRYFIVSMKRRFVFCSSNDDGSLPSHIGHCLADRAKKGFNILYGVGVAEISDMTVPNVFRDLPLVGYDIMQLNE